MKFKIVLMLLIISLGVNLYFLGKWFLIDQWYEPLQEEQATFKIGQDQYLYIDSGLGTSVAPIRFLNKSQLSLIKITDSVKYGTSKTGAL